MNFSHLGFEGPVAEVQAAGAWGNNFSLVTEAPDAHEGSQYALLSSGGAFGFDSFSQLSVKDAVAGEMHFFGGWFRLDPGLFAGLQNGAKLTLSLIEATGGGGGIPPWTPNAASIQIEIVDASIGSVKVTKTATGKPTTVTNPFLLTDWVQIRHNIVTLNSGPKLEFLATTNIGNPRGYWNVDDLEAPLMKSTVNDFLDSLKTVVEGIDPNIGVVFKTGMIWRTDNQLKNDVATFDIQTAGLFDAVGRVGKNVTRFWFADVRIEPRPLTNGSAEYQTTITLTAFYQWEEDNSQEQTLRDAAVEILDALNDKTVENTTLNTGQAYCGFLTQRPRMLTGIEQAEIGDGAISGHTCQLEITYFEEVPY